MAKTEVKKVLTDEEYIAAHIRYGKSMAGWHEAKFTCADGYQYTVADAGATGRAAKSVLKDRLISRVMGQNKHPIQ